MHDIICPHCGNSFIARDVAFDLSSLITTLLFDDPKEKESVESAGFKYFADEESIITNTDPLNKTPLFCDSSIGPGYSDPWYPFIISGDTLYKYIEAKIGGAFVLSKTLSSIATVKKGQYNITQINEIRMLYQSFFSAAQNGDSFDIEDANVQTAIRILLYINSHRNKSVTLQVRLYSSKHNVKRPNYLVPDIMFIFNGIGQPSIRVGKCCRYCGAAFPTEYGYYKMMPVVLLGSHFAGKTSFLLAMLYSTRALMPFVSENSTLKFHSLDNDKDLVAFDKNVDRFARGLPPIKTDFVNIPILNVRVNDYIYTFVDWPGEKFINDQDNNDLEFIFNTKPVIHCARHFLCFIEPSQMDPDIRETEENVNFTPIDLLNRFRQHFAFADRVNSIVCILNKVDVLMASDPTGLLSATMSVPESDVFTGSSWNADKMHSIDENVRRYMMALSPSLFSGFQQIEASDNKVYLAAAPYGGDPEEEKKGKAIVTHGTSRAGMPFLSILKTDGLIK